MIIIEGIIGAGKTTLAEEIHERAPYSKLFLEPVEGNPYLTRFYEDMHRWGLEMQYWLLSKRFKMHQEGIAYEWESGFTSIFDRSIYGDAPFASMLHDAGFIDELGYNAYMQHKKCMQKFLLVPQLVIFLDTPIDTCLDRIHNKRGRECEKGITKEYLEALRKELIKAIKEDLTPHTKVEILTWCEGMALKDIPNLSKYINLFRKAE